MHTKNKAIAVATRMAAMALLALLSACAGTVKQHTRINGDVSGVEGVGKVVARMSPAAVAQQADNPQFSRDELATYLYRKLESKGMVAAGAPNHVDILVTDIRVRSAAAAVLLGVLAGEDRIVGTVRVLDSANKPLRSFEIKASYALGGWGGGQDSMRMNWMYDKFSELAMQELDKIVALPRSTTARTQTTVLAPGAAAPALVLAPSSPNAPPTTPAPAPAPAASAPVIVPDVASLPTTGVLEDADAVPVGDKGREAYRQWLTWKSPRVFVVADGLRWNYARGTNPTDPAQPRDPVERALKFCQEHGRTGCTLYAVDDRVVYQKPASTAQR
ncbi:DUF4410 domain-containing protein [Piscinibacter sp. XHJ-5]|uniref:DUF4410 domain-containing protein n=1 Tax=Piscinibacter sp. XHJ-5 TaxID=3037797 RepID=UPI00245326FE|nr:DUF4410 domain-containing protein [Piscinibacter sp. XHJ-5]